MGCCQGAKAPAKPAAGALDPGEPEQEPPAFSSAEEAAGCGGGDGGAAAEAPTGGGPAQHVLDPVMAVVDPAGPEFCLGDCKLVMGHFVMMLGEDQVMGEGTFSICRKGVDLRTGELVAIRTFKENVDLGGADVADQETVRLKKFIKQVRVLQALSTPLEKPDDASLWHDALENVAVEDIFMRLIDYSRGADGQPGPDVDDGVLYLVTELASYSLDDYLFDRKEQSRPLSRTRVRELTRAVLLVCAALHAKGLCHLDLKPENLMIFNSRIKLIDVDGCVRTGTTVAIGDSSVSFSPAFCSPEWARWMTSNEESEHITIHPSLDVWSVGMALGQLITLDVIMEQKYGEFEGPDARTQFLMWLSQLQKPYLPKTVQSFDPGFLKVLNSCLVCNQQDRQSLASCLSLQFVSQDAGGENKVALEDEDIDDLPSPRVTRNSLSAPLKPDLSVSEPRLQGVTWQLCPGEDEYGFSSWTHCDLWLTREDNLCFYCQEQEGRFVYMDALELSRATVAMAGPCMHGVAVEIQGAGTGAPCERFAFADTDTAGRWVEELQSVRDRWAGRSASDPPKSDDAAGATESVVLELKCNDRCKPVPSRNRHEFESVFRTLLWKHSQASDARLRHNWQACEVWVAANFSLVYYSPYGTLIHYGPRLLERATVEPLPLTAAAMPWAFQLVVPERGGVREAPAIFAALSEPARDHWIREFRVHQVRRAGLRHLRPSLLRSAYSQQGGDSIFATAGITAELSMVKDLVRLSSGIDPDGGEGTSGFPAKGKPRGDGSSKAGRNSNTRKLKPKARSAEDVPRTNDAAEQPKKRHSKGHVPVGSGNGKRNNGLKERHT